MKYYINFRSGAAFKIEWQGPTPIADTGWIRRLETLGENGLWADAARASLGLL